jgi:hypothetical protein
MQWGPPMIKRAAMELWSRAADVSVMAAIGGY